MKTKKSRLQISLSVILWMMACYTTRAQTDQFEIIDISWESKGVKIAGSLWLPQKEGPHPLIALVHGSGPARRNQGNNMANHFVNMGYAILTHDKRGVGESGGQFVERNNTSRENLDLLAGDISAGIGFVKNRADIDSNQIGLWGVSQAGWIVPLISSMRDDIKFSILISGPTVTVGEENYYSDFTGNGSKNPGLTQQEISEKLKEKGPYGFDPIPFLKGMDRPGLWLLGSADQSIPIPETVAILKRLIEEDKKDFTYKVFDGASHGLRVNGLRVPAYWEVQDRFLSQKVKVRIK